MIVDEPGGGRDARRPTPAPARGAQPARHPRGRRRGAVVQPVVRVAAAQPARTRGGRAAARAGRPAGAAHAAGRAARGPRTRRARSPRRGRGGCRALAHRGRRHGAHRRVPVGRARHGAAGAHPAARRAPRPARRGDRARARGRAVRGRRARLRPRDRRAVPRAHPRRTATTSTGCTWRPTRSGWPLPPHPLVEERRRRRRDRGHARCGQRPRRGIRHAVGARAAGHGIPRVGRAAVPRRRVRARRALRDRRPDGAHPAHPIGQRRRACCPTSCGRARRRA